MKLVIDTRVPVEHVASLHEYFSKSHNILTKSKLGTLVFELAYTILLHNNKIAPHTTESASHYVNSIYKTKTTLDVGSMKMPNLEMPAQNQPLVEANAEQAQEILERLKKARTERGDSK